MLQSLKLNQFLLFKNKEINFSGEFTVITGETGSGKSMFIKALRFVLGEKQDLPAMDYSVAAEFNTTKADSKIKELLDEYDINYEDNVIILRRNLTKEGKSKAFVNDVPVTIKLLKSIGEELIEFHSQHKQLDAFSANNSLLIIDQFLDNQNLLAQINQLYQKYIILEDKLKKLVKEEEDLKRDQDYVEFALQEIKNLNLKIDEEEELIEKKRNFADKQKINQVLLEIKQNFSHGNNIISNLIRGQRGISKYEGMNDLNDQIEACLEALSELESSTENKIRENNILDNLDQIEERLSKIKELSRKYRCSSNQLIDIGKDYEEKIERLSEISKDIKISLEEKEKILKEYFLLAQELSLQREKVAKKLEKMIINELKLLKLEQVELHISISADETRVISPKGKDKCLFMIKTNKGFNFAPINEIASGGELSRIMLAFKVALATTHKKTTIIFDEIDSGTGGAVAEVIGKRLKLLAEHDQIITISHQPQVAAKASQHLVIKKSNQDVASADLVDLVKEEKINEIARMLSGENITKSAIDAAISLMEA